MSSSSQAGLTIVGAAAGFFVGGPVGALYGGVIGYTLGMSSLSTTLPPQEGPRISDLSAQRAGYGWNIPRSWGTVAHYGAIIWSGGINETRHTVTNDVGGKGGPTTEQEQTTFTYSASFAVLFHDGEITGVRRVWLNEFLVYDNGGISDYGSLTNEQLTGWIVTKTTGLSEDDGQLTIYRGTNDQPPDPTIQAYEGTDNTPGFRDRAYLVLTDLQLAKFGNRLPQVKVEYVAIDTSADTSSSVVKTVDYSDIMEGGPWNDMVTTFERDGTCHLFVGDWDNFYLSANVKYYKVLPSGAVSWMVGFTAYTPGVGALMDSDIPMLPVYVIGVGIVIYEPGGSLTPDSDGVFDFGLQASDAPGMFFTYQDYVFFQRGTTTSGRIFMWCEPQTDGNDIRIWNYEKYIFVNEFGFPGTAIRDSYYDISVASGSKFGIGVSANYLYVVYMGGTINQYDFQGNLLDTWSFTPSVAIGGRGRVLVDPDNELRVWFKAQSYLHCVTDGVYEFFGQIPNSNNYDPYANGFNIYNDIMIYNSRQSGEILFSTLRDLSRAGESLDKVVSDLCLESGASLDDIEVTSLAGTTVAGFTRSRVSSASKNIEMLMQAYQFSAYEDDHKIIFKMRGGGIDKVVSADDLGAGLDRASTEILPYSRIDDQSLPLVVNVNYFDYASDYEQGTQTSRRSAIYETEQTITIDLAIVMSETEARRTAERIQSALWTARNSYKTIRLPPKYTDIVPTDIVQVTVDGITHIVRAGNVNVGEFVEVSGVSEIAADYSSYITGESPVRPYGGASIAGPSEAYFLDLPALRNQDGDAGYYIAAHGYYPRWRGCVIYTKDTSGAWNKVTSVLAETTVGVCETVLPAGDTEIFDGVSTVTVRMRAGTLTSTTYEDMIAAKTVNAAAVGINGRWELLQFQTVTSNGNGSYTISGFIRGQNGTEWAMELHAENDLFIVLDANRLSRAYMNDIGAQYTMRAVSIGSAFQYGTDYSFTNNATALKPYSPTGFASVPQLDGSYVFTWVRRGRLYGEWDDYKDVPLSEQTERYQVKTLVDGDVVDTEIVTAPTTTWTIPPGAQPIVALLHLNTDFTDETGTVWTNNGSASISSSVKKYGAGSLDCTGGGKFIYSPISSRWAFGTADFTIEFWAYLSGTPVTFYGIVSNQSGAAGFIFALNSSRQVRYQSNNGSVAQSSALSTATWYHIAYSRSGTSGRLFVGGNLEDTITDSQNITATNSVRIGSDAVNSFNGYIDDVRITKGAALYTANFTPPAGELSNTNITGFVIRIQQDSDLYGFGEALEVVL